MRMVTDDIDRIEPGRTPVTAALSGLLGSCIEWYDYYIYVTATSLVFNTIFFPSFDPVVGTLLAYGTFAAGAIMRPLGGILFGHFGDKIGRKSTLIWTLILMGGATVLIGVVPSYGLIGIWAPALLILLRCVQGLAFGGEWAGAVLISVEHAPKRRSGFFGSVPLWGSPIALFLSTGTFAWLSRMPKDAFLDWGWRIPFLGSAVLIGIGLFLRLRLLESPEFRRSQAEGVVSSPIGEVVRRHLKAVAIATGLILCTTVAFSVQAIFVVSYAVQSVHVPKEVVLDAVLIGSLAELLLLPVFAIVADRIGLRPVALFGAIWTALFSFPFFTFVNAGDAFSITAGICLAMVGISALFAVLPAYTSKLFDTRVRYTGLSLSYGVAAGLLGGLTPLLTSSLYLWARASWPIALYVIAVAAISLVAILASPARSRSDRA